MKRALVLSLICVVGFAFTSMAASLTGSWDTDITILPGQTHFNDAISIVSKLTVNYIIGDWTFTSITALGSAGWTDQDFNVVGVLGAFSISTAMDLETDPVGFGDLDVTVSVSIAGVSLVWDVNLDAFPDMSITASGTAGDVGVVVKLTFGDPEDVSCDFNWSKADIDLTFGFCCVDLKLAIDITCDGFEDATITFGGIVVPNLPWLTIGGSLEFNLTTGKVFQLTPVFDFGMDICFDLYWSDDVGYVYSDYYNGFKIFNIILDGIGITCDIPVGGGVTFTGITYWGPGIGTPLDAPGLLKGYLGKYFEAYQIATKDDACCGPFGFSLTVYFEEGLSDQLFDVDLFVAKVSLEVATQFVFDMGLTVDASDGFTQWTVGFLVTW